jgi:glycerophosphoryl diester phosphodiesterase
MPPHIPKIYGHRGSPLVHAENSLPSFRHALLVGADGLEMDVHLTRDGVVVVSHDDNVFRTAGVDRSIRGSNFTEVQSWSLRSPVKAKEQLSVPSLEAVLSEFSNVPMSVDIKPNDLRVVRAVLAVIRKCGATSSVRLASFHHAVLKEVRALGYEGETGLSQREVALCTFLPERVCRALLFGTAAQVPVRWTPAWFEAVRNHSGSLLLRNLGVGVQGSVQNFGSFAHRGFVEKAKRLGLEVHFWTVNDVTVAQELAALGADALVTDDPEGLVSAFAVARAATGTA